MMKNFVEKSKVGVLMFGSERFKKLGVGLQQGSYEERKHEDSSLTLGQLKELFTVVFPGIVYSKEDIQQAIDSFFIQKVDFIIVEFLSWSEDFAWIRFLRDMPEIPIVFINPVKKKVSFQSTTDENDFIDFLCSGTLVGSMQASGSIPRIGRNKIKIVIGSREEIIDQIIVFSKAAKTKRILLQSKFGLLANYNDLMWSTYIDPYNLFAKIGPELQYIAYSTYSDEISLVSDGDTKLYQDELVSLYKVGKEVDPVQFFESVRASIALARLIKENDIDGMIFNDLDPAMFKLVGLRPGFYHPSINNRSSVLVPEADTGACVMMYVLKQISGKHVNFIEPFHIEYADNTFAGGHAGPIDYNDPNHLQNVIISRDVRFAKSNYKYAGAPFAWYRISPGRKTMAHFSEINGKYKLVCCLVDSLDGKHILESYSHSIFKPLIPVKEFFNKILTIGTTQHFAIVDGNFLEELKVFAEIMEFEYHEIN